MTQAARRLGVDRREARDDELFEEIARGDLGPLGVLFDRHHASVRHFLLRVLANPAEADDLVQETFLTAARAAESFQRGAPARPFLIGIAAQLVRRRRRGFARLRAMLDAFGRAPAEPPPSPEQGTQLREQHAELHAAMAKLSDEHRLVLAMVELGEMSGVDAARALGVPPGTVWRRLSEARSELARRMKRREA